MTILQVTQIQGLTFSLENLFWKTVGWGRSNSPTLFIVKIFLKFLKILSFKLTGNSQGNIASLH